MSLERYLLLEDGEVFGRFSDHVSLVLSRDATAFTVLSPGADMPISVAGRYGYAAHTSNGSAILPAAPADETAAFAPAGPPHAPAVSSTRHITAYCPTAL